MRDEGIFSRSYTACGRDVWGAVKGSALPATPKETARMISSGLKGPKDLVDDGNELRRMIRGLTCAVAAALAPVAGEPGQA
jgi:hypothetical protein